MDTVINSSTGLEVLPVNFSMDSAPFERTSKNEVERLQWGIPQNLSTPEGFFTRSIEFDVFTVQQKNVMEGDHSDSDGDIQHIHQQLAQLGLTGMLATFDNGLEVVCKQLGIQVVEHSWLLLADTANQKAYEKRPTTVSTLFGLPNNVHIGGHVKNLQQTQNLLYHPEFSSEYTDVLGRKMYNAIVSQFEPAGWYPYDLTAPKQLVAPLITSDTEKSERPSIPKKRDIDDLSQRRDITLVDIDPRVATAIGLAFMNL